MRRSSRRRSRRPPPRTAAPADTRACRASSSVSERRTRPRTPQPTRAVGGRQAAAALESMQLSNGFRERRHDLEQVAHDAVIRDLEDGCLRVLVDRDDATRRRHPREVLDRAGDPDRDVELGAHRLARLPDLVAVRAPAREAPTVAPSASASCSTSAKFSGPLSPRPPDTMISDSVRSSLPPLPPTTPVTTARGADASHAKESGSTGAAFPASGGAAANTLGRSAASAGTSGQATGANL